MMRIKSSFFDSRDVGICSGGFPFTYLAQRDVRDGVTDVGDVYLVKASLSDHLKYVLLISSVSVKPSPLRYLPRDRRKLIGFECTQRKSESPHYSKINCFIDFRYGPGTCQNLSLL